VKNLVSGQEVPAFHAPFGESSRHPDLACGAEPSLVSAHEDDVDQRTPTANAVVRRTGDADNRGRFDPPSLEHRSFPDWDGGGDMAALPGTPTTFSISTPTNRSYSCSWEQGPEDQRRASAAESYNASARLPTAVDRKVQPPVVSRIVLD